MGNSMICSDIWHKYHEWYFKLLYVISRAVRRMKFWDNFEISSAVFMPLNITYTDHAIICLYYYPQKICSFHM